MRIAFSVHAEPKGKGRPRFTSRGRPYTPAETVAYERLVKVTCQDIMRRQRLTTITAPVAIDLTFRLVPPASFSKKRRLALLLGDERITGRFDIDNLSKAILDALNGVAFVDDRLIVELTARKVAAEACGIDIIVESVSEQAGRDAGQPDGQRFRGGAVETEVARAGGYSWDNPPPLGDPPAG